MYENFNFFPRYVVYYKGRPIGSFPSFSKARNLVLENVKKEIKDILGEELMDDRIWNMIENDYQIEKEFYETE
jgi:hypothetical protein